MITDIAIYHKKQRDYITVFTFSEKTSKLVQDCITEFELRTKGEPREGNKPGSLKFAIYTTRDHMNECLQTD